MDNQSFKKMTKDGEKPDFEEKAKWLISILDEFDKTARAFNQEDEQWFLDWQDAINEISVR